jgi:hypothetical protein
MVALVACSSGPLIDAENQADREIRQLRSKLEARHFTCHLTPTRNATATTFCKTRTKPTEYLVVSWYGDYADPSVLAPRGRTPSATCFAGYSLYGHHWGASTNSKAVQSRVRETLGGRPTGPKCSQPLGS